MMVIMMMMCKNLHIKVMISEAALKVYPSHLYQLTFYIMFPYQLQVTEEMRRFAGTYVQDVIDKAKIIFSKRAKEKQDQEHLRAFAKKTALDVLESAHQKLEV